MRLLLGCILLLVVLVWSVFFCISGWLKCMEDKGSGRLCKGIFITLFLLQLIVGVYSAVKVQLIVGVSGEGLTPSASAIKDHFVLGFALNVIFLVMQLMIILKDDKTNAVSIKSRKVDTLLCFFLGFFGVHRLYEGKIGSGIFRLVSSLLIIIIGSILAIMNVISFEIFPIHIVILGILWIILICILSVWQFIDMLLILFGDSRDASGNRITRWNSIGILKSRGVDFDTRDNLKGSNLIFCIRNSPVSFFSIGALFVIPVVLFVGAIVGLIEDFGPAYMLYIISWLITAIIYFGFYRCMEDKGVSRVFKTIYMIPSILSLIITIYHFSALWIIVVNFVLILHLFVMNLVIIFMNDRTNAASVKSRKADLLLCYFLGFFGAHRFYEGKIVTGIFRLLGLILAVIFSLRFPTLFKVLSCVLLIWQAVDLILILYGKSSDASGNKITRWNSVEFLKSRGVEVKDVTYASVKAPVKATVKDLVKALVNKKDSKRKHIGLLVTSIVFVVLESVDLILLLFSGPTFHGVSMHVALIYAGVQGITQKGNLKKIKIGYFVLAVIMFLLFCVLYHMDKEILPLYMFVGPVIMLVMGLFAASAEKKANKIN